MQQLYKDGAFRQGVQIQNRQPGKGSNIIGQQHRTMAGN